MNIDGLKSNWNKKLFSLVSSRYKISFIKGSNESSWGSYIDDNKKAIIEWAESLHPEEAFVHELLHFECQLNGFKRLKYGVSSADRENTGAFSVFVSALDNELQHHKMYRRFIDLGYDEKNFYNDNDILETPKHVFEFLEQKNYHKLTLLTQYLTAISPGAELIFSDTKKLKNEFRNKCTTRYIDVLDCIDLEFKKWTESTSYVCEQTLKNIFHMIPGSSKTFIGYGNKSEFPNNGFFTSEKFNLSDF